MRLPLLAIGIAIAAGACATTSAPDPAIRAVVAAPSRTAANVARDRYRHPAETLAFFGVRPTDTVVEFIPGGGWYSEILAPLVRGEGRYVALVPAGQEARTRAMLEGKGLITGGLTTGATVAALDGAGSGVPANSADVVLTFRNVHNLLMSDEPAAGANAFHAFFAMLKPGGTLGVVDHRLPEQMDTSREKSSGYIKRSTVVRLAMEAGFRLAGESAVNANPQDTHDHPSGVWTLPPSLRLKEVDRERYTAIGESDRMTLKFVKPR